MMSGYPPSQDAVIEAFCNWISEQRGSNHHVLERPDTTDRKNKEIDYLIDSSRGQILAVEVSSLWRNNEAGKDDSYFGKWSDRVVELTRGQINGQYRVYIPMRVVPGVSPQAFATALTGFIATHRKQLLVLHKHSRGTAATLAGMDVRVSIRSELGSDLTFARFYEPPDFSKQVQRFLNTRGPKLTPHKERGRETWLLAYNTFWVAMSDHEVRDAFSNALNPTFDYIDHLAVVEGYPPNDAWVELIR
jgi:hypothetical protein